MNINVSSVATDILGVPDRKVIEAIIQGEGDPDKLAALACGGLERKVPGLKAALEGKILDHHRFLLETLWSQLRSVEETIEKILGRIGLAAGF